MDCQKIEISIIVPFYRGNQYMNQLFASINHVANTMAKKVKFEVIMVNDSCDVQIVLPSNINHIDVKIFENERNMGIQKTRINGLKHAKGGWIIFLDQDDELLAEGFEEQLMLTNQADIIVGNGLYQYGNKKKLIYKNRNTMEYLIQKKRFIEIRNLIPSPGECLIRKTAIPKLWIDSPIKHNGADDWLLWILLFQNGCKFQYNEKMVYVHNDSDGQNLSLDLEKMYISAMEMYEFLKNQLKDTELNSLRDAIQFKFLQDSGKLQIKDIWLYRKTIYNNLIYKIKSI
ncbi:MAG: glycosyltransferase [Lachnospiraceae bacterium]|jgi:Glycosyltransferases involved in cell wall biogenesis|nr:glycosyltransferase family 2 protein [Lachnospiraceae bacterium]MCI8826662.1 glycosyltransferase family 2 protein [Lachnospiraceae bacterium]MCI9370628.1 glycosyltransferase family 2 protein [Lachnospiraceae bacterium]